MPQHPATSSAPTASPAPTTPTASSVSSVSSTPPIPRNARRLTPRATVHHGVMALGLVLGLLSAGGIPGLQSSPVSAAPVSATAAASTPKPPTPTGLPSGIEGLAPYVAADSCEPAAKPGVLKLARLLVATYPGTSYLTSRTCGTDALPTSEHYDGRAVDWMNSVRVPKQAAQASAVLSWLFATDAAGHTNANVRRLGVMYVIWNNRIWGSYSTSWRAYSSCASHPESAWDTTCHRNHMHFSLSWDGARAADSFWSKKVARPDYGPCRVRDLNWAAPVTVANPVRCATYPHVSAPAGASTLLRALTTYSGMSLQSGSSGPAVKAVQQAVGATADGDYGPRTAAAVSKWQSAHHVTATGTVNTTTWRALLAAFKPKAAAALAS